MFDNIRERLAEQDRGVSPVIGVILMVAITVILAAVIGSFVLGLGDQLNSQGPQVSIGIQGETNTSTSDEVLVRLNHNNGPDLQLSDLAIEVRNASSNELAARFTGDSSDASEGTLSSSLNITLNGNSPTGTFSAGDQYQINEKSGQPYSNGDQIRILVKDTDSGATLADQTFTLG